MIQVETSISDEMLAELFLSQVMRDFKKDKILEEKEKAIKSLPKITTYATGSRYLVSTHLINTKNILATNRL